jgi:ABC-type dipeptide/oligopeptide/nickel transport system permease component
MWRYLLRRLAVAIPTVVGIAIVGFLLVHLVPGDPVRLMLGEKATPESISSAREQLGLDRSLVAQLGTFLSGLVQGDLGTSIVRRRPVVDVVMESAEPTLLLVGYSIVLSLLIAVPLGVLAAARRDRPTDHAIRILTLVGFTLPPFWFALILIRTLAVGQGWLPVSGYAPGFGGAIRSLTLPAISLAVVLGSLLARTLRASMVDQLGTEYVEAARARGLGERRIVLKHAQRNALLPTITVLALNVGWLLGACVIVESVFAIPGLGQLLVTSVSDRDFPVITGIGLVMGVVVVLANLVADLAYAAVDPRVRLA